jgi:hypothetical protein
MVRHKRDIQLGQNALPSYLSGNKSIRYVFEFAGDVGKQIKDVIDRIETHDGSDPARVLADVADQLHGMIENLPFNFETDDPSKDLQTGVATTDPAC